MPIKTVITCDGCGRVLENEDYMSVRVKLEIDFNHLGGQDFRDSMHGIFCLDECYKEAKARLKYVFMPRKT